nr:unnamed protein product [Digitaria exilis]
MVSLGRRGGVMPHGGCLAALLALAALASSHLLGAAAVEASGGNWHVVPVRSLVHKPTCTATEAAHNSTTLSVVHRHGPCSPLRSRGGDPPSHAEILGRDQERVAAIHRKIGPAATSKSANMTLQTHWGEPLGTSNYFITAGLGTPARSLSVEFDTGSEESWVQCSPCRSCYVQHDPLFDPSNSSTYSTVPCDAHECGEFVGLQQNCSSSDNTCRYGVAYGDQSKTVGNLAQDTLTLTPSATVPGFLFGCGHDDAGVFGEVDGLFGFGHGKASLPSQAQASANYGEGFSYCLPSSASTIGYLTLGVASTAPTNAKFTAMLPGQGGSFYYLNITGINVAGRAIKVAPAAFQTAAGTIIDSGTAFSRLPPRVYAALRSAFRLAMGRRYKRVAAPEPFDTCYDLSGHEAVRVPSVELVFGDGATVRLDPTGVLYAWDDAAQTCLRFAPSDDGLGVLGNVQQRTLSVVYDVANQKIGFGAGGCA